MTLSAEISILAKKFASEVLAAIKGASLDEILSETGSSKVAAPTKRGPGLAKPSTERKRRGPEDRKRRPR